MTSANTQKFKYPKNCAVCGKEFQGTTLQKFCSNACKSKWRRDMKLDNIMVVCPVCNKEFSTSRFKPQTYCSKECSSKAHIGWYDRKQKQL